MWFRDKLCSIKFSDYIDSHHVFTTSSLLESHGVAHNAGFACRFRSDSVRSGFDFRGVAYRPCGPVGNARSKTMRSPAGTYLATTREQTVVDCLGKPALAGGVEEAVRSLTSFVYLDVEELVGLAVDAGPWMASRVGWLLSAKKAEWHVGEESLSLLEGRLGPGPYRLGPASAGSAGWVASWRLVLPEDEEEVMSWITRS